MIKCILVDDEPLAQEIVAGYIELHPELELIRKCSNALEAFDALQNEHIDLMFLDIRIPSINGIDFVKALKNPPKIIFTTAFSEYAVQGFELDAIDYLLKPITPERFEKSIQKLFKVSRREEVSEEKKYTYFKVSGKLIKVFHADLCYAQSVKDYILLKTTSGSYLTHMTMKHLESLLPGETFIRIHRSYLVNKQHIDALDKSGVKVASEMIPIGEHYKQNLTTLS